MSFSSVYQSSVSLTSQVTLDPINQTTFQVMLTSFNFFLISIGFHKDNWNTVMCPVEFSEKSRAVLEIKTWLFLLHWPSHTGPTPVVSGSEVVCDL